MQRINLIDKFGLFQDHWSPKIIAELNGQFVKLAKIEGTFDWHCHKEEDELFYVVKGKMSIDLEDKTIDLKEGECTVIPKGINHRPRAESECWIMLFEPKSTLNTGNVITQKTKTSLDKI